MAHGLLSGEKIRLRYDQLGPIPPYPIDDDTLFVSYMATAETNCHRALGWPVATRFLYLYSSTKP